ncbi:MAG: FeoA family protein [Verrucomicrobiota bacterium]|nr:FeoA family protein [Verrucomicrobiota bacterium]
MTLNELSAGQTATISKINAAGSIRQRLMELGLLRGTPIEVVRFAPMGDPIEIKFKGYHLSLRKEEAATIEVSPSPSSN